MAKQRNDVLYSRLNANPYDGFLRVTYPPNYQGTTFSMSGNKLFAQTDNSFYIPTFALSNGILTASVEVDDDSSSRFIQYLKAVRKPFKKLSKLEFLNPDNSVAFSLDSNRERKFSGAHDSRAFIQSGNLNVSLQNGKRRNASVQLSNLDNAYDYAVNKLWYGKRIRLSMGLVLPDGTEYYLPQGVFYLENPKSTFSTNQKTVNYNLVDKWAYLDGSLFGKLDTTYQVEQTDVFSAMQAVLNQSIYTYGVPRNKMDQIDNVTPVFTAFYNGRTYLVKTSDGTYIQKNMTDVPYTITASNTFSELLLELNTIIAGLIGYDQTGALRVEPSQDSVSDSDKPILWYFTPENSQLLSVSESVNTSSIYNDVLIIGEGMSGYEVYGRATNYDPASDLNVNLIGRRIYKENKAEYWNADQCVDLAEYYLKQMTVQSKSITIQCPQMFHLMENRLISVKRTDKPGSPVERHLIQSFSIPIGETGAMSINATSVCDKPLMITTSSRIVESAS